MKRWHRPLAGAGAVAALLTLAACGGGGDNTSPHQGPAPTNTLAYVDTACRDGADGFSATQELRVRRGESAPVTIARVPMIGPVQVSIVCGLFGMQRNGIQSLAFGAFQRLGVSPDGTGIVFEVTDDFSIVGPSIVPPEQKGIFFIRVDGSGLRRLGDASRTPAITPSGRTIPNFQFSPNGRLVSLIDMGPGSGGEDAAQLFVLDVDTGERTQLTHLPPAPLPGLDGIDGGLFLDDRTNTFATTSNLDGHNPDGKLLTFTVSIDDGEIKPFSEVLVPGMAPILVPVITGFGRLVVSLPLPGDSREVFIINATNVLQLTNFGRSDTGTVGNLLSVDGERVFFTASVNPPLDTNPSETCQVFSVDALGGDLRQLTRFGAGRHSALGCFAQRQSEGCRTDLHSGGKGSQDARTGTLVFVSSCDPFGANPNGEQIFAMNPDGSSLHALTDPHAVVRNPDGSVEAELPGPWSYGPHR